MPNCSTNIAVLNLGGYSISETGLVRSFHVAQGFILTKVVVSGERGDTFLDYITKIVTLATPLWQTKHESAPAVNCFPCIQVEWI